MSGVCFFDKFDQTKRPRSRVELHVHLDGAVRLDTVWELSKTKGIDIGCESFEDFDNAVRVKRPASLEAYLKSFQLLLPVFVGCGDALERVAYELCEDQAKEGVLYFEARYSPQMYANTRSPVIPTIVQSDDPVAFTPRHAVEALTRGLDRGQKDFGIKVRTILVCIRGRPEWNEEVLGLCLEFQSQGVVGMDIAGPEDFSEEDIAIFKKAACLGVHRTAHAGQADTPNKVTFVMDEMLVERVGHGYRSVLDKDVYDRVLSSGVHLECCPHSSLLTGAVPLTLHKHPIVKFAEDGVNFSINKDDPSITGTTLDDEYEMLRKMGLDHSHFARANFNAARSSFLPENEKLELLEQLRNIYGAEF